MPTEAHKRRHAARRAVKPGYPVTKTFKTRAEVDEYFSGDRITCLLCGRQFRWLYVHIKKIHGKTVEWYRENYGLRWRRGTPLAAVLGRRGWQRRDGDRRGPLRS